MDISKDLILFSFFSRGFDVLAEHKTCTMTRTRQAVLVKIEQFKADRREEIHRLTQTDNSRRRGSGRERIKEITMKAFDARLGKKR